MKKSLRKVEEKILYLNKYFSQEMTTLLVISAEILSNSSDCVIKRH